MSRFLSSPTPSAPSHSGSAPLVTPPLLGSPVQSPYSETGPQHGEVSGSDKPDPKVPPRAGVLAASKSSPAVTAHTVPPPTGAIPVAADPVPRAPSSDDGHAAHHGSIVPAYPYNVAMAPSAFVGGPLPDDSEVTTRLPSICVDYLSHDWAEDDVWTSWKAMTRHKTEIANGVRLENASWRTWAKQRGNLKTVSPETLNWLKDSDVTWLYGPLHTAVDAVPPPREATANERLGLESLRTISDARTKSGSTPPTPEVKKVELTRSASDQASGTSSPTATQAAAAAARSNYGAGGGGGRGSPTPAAPRRKKPQFHAKPILKYRSLSDILLPHGQSTSPVIEATGMDFEDQATISVHHARSDSHLVRLNSLNRGKGGGSRRGSPIGSPMSSSPERTASDSSSSYVPHARNSQHAAQKKKERRHISFNHRVEQCIAIDSSEDNRSSTYSTASSSDEDEDDVLTFGARSPRHSSFMRNAAAAQPKEPHTIARLGPTTLKSVEMYPAPSPAVVFSSDPTVYDPDPSSSSPPEGSYGQQLVEEADYDASGAGSGRAGGTAASGPAGQQNQQAAAAGRRVIYDYSTAESQIRSQWDVDDEDYAMGFDYFTGPSGPDVGVGDEYDMAQYGSTHLIGGTHNDYGVGNGGGGSDPYLSHGPYSPTSPYHPGTSTLDPSVHATATQMPHYRDALNTAANSGSSSNNSSTDVRGDSSSPGIAHGPHVPPASAREAGTPKKSAMKGGRSREASVESVGSSTSPASSTTAPSPPLSSLSSSPTGIQAVATAIPAHVRPGVVRRGTSEEGERGRSASRGSSSSLEREASAARRSSSASISPAAYSPPASVTSGGFGASSPSSPSAAAAASSPPSSGAKPIAIEPTWKVAGSYESLDSVLSGSGRGNGASGGGYFGDRQGQDSSSGPGAYGMGRIITSSSVDSMGSLGSFGNAPITPTSPTFASPDRRPQPPLPNPNGVLDDDDDDDKLVEDISTLDVDGGADDQPASMPLQKVLTSLFLPLQVNSTSNVLDFAAPTSTMNGPSTHAPSGSVSAATVPAPDHVRVAPGPRLRNPSPSATSPAVTSEQVPAQSLDARDPSSNEDDFGSSSGLLKRTTSSSSLSFARQSLLRATRDRDESSPRSSIDSSDNDDYRQPAASASASVAAPAAPSAASPDDLGVADAGVGSGINVAGTARDLLGALSKGLWG
ncbi:hypothetical protein RHOSPDRAFT_9144, partial [Rhodotorula sp. JG-1b]